MTPDPIYTQLQEAAWRGKLTSAQEARLCAWLTANPEARQDWEADSVLSEALSRLPNAAVPSNFAARVMSIVERKMAAAASGGKQKKRRSWLDWRWLPRAALTALVLGTGLVSYHYSRTITERKELARSLVAVSDVSSLPSPDVLQDFDAIRALKTTPPPDEALLALFK